MQLIHSPAPRSESPAKGANTPRKLFSQIMVQYRTFLHSPLRKTNKMLSYQARRSSARRTTLQCSALHDNVDTHKPIREFNPQDLGPSSVTWWNSCRAQILEIFSYQKFVNFCVLDCRAYHHLLDVAFAIWTLHISTRQIQNMRVKTGSETGLKCTVTILSRSGTFMVACLPVVLLSPAAHTLNIQFFMAAWARDRSEGE